MKNRPSSALILTLAAVLLAGCTLGPDYRAPGLDLPVAYKEGAPWKAAAPSDALPKGEWWKVYGDPVLDDLEARAAAGSPTLQAAAARLERARAAARVSEGDELPRIDLNASAARSRTPGDLSASGEGTTGNLLSLPFDLGYEVDLWGRVRRSVEAAHADAAGSAADYQTALLSLQAEVARSYFALRALDGETALLERTVALRRERLELVGSLFEHGQVGELDVARAETELAAAEAEAAAAARQRAELEHALALLSGEMPARFALPAAPLDLEPPEVASGLPSHLLERRPDVAGAERRMAAASARIGVAETAFFPAVRLGGSAGFGTTGTGSVFDWDNRAWALGPAVSLPIFEGGRNRANLKGARAAYEEAAALYRQQVLVAFAEVEDALSGLRTLAEQDAAQRRAVAGARQAAAISDKRYRAGLVSYLEVVDAERTALQSERAATRLRGERLQASVALVKALGGGWQDPS